jgi:hypothetical protein
LGGDNHDDWQILNQFDFENILIPCLYTGSSHNSKYLNRQSVRNI